MTSSRHFKLADDQPNLRRLVLADEVKLTDQQISTTVTVLRTGRFRHPTYGEFEVTPQLLSEMVQNFNKDTYRQKIWFDVNHESDKGAAGEITKLFVDGNRLRAQVTWTEYGVKANRERKFIYVSAEYDEQFKDNESGQSHGAVLLGAGLVTRPFIKGMDTVQLSESNPSPITLIDSLFGKTIMTKADYLKRLREFLAQRKAKKSLSEKLEGAFNIQADQLGDDDTKLKALCEAFEAAADEAIKQLADAPADQPITLNITTAGLSEADVTRLLSEHEAATARKLAEQQTTLSNKRKLFTDAIDAADGLSDAVKTELKANASIVLAEMPDANVKALADSYITMGNQQEAAKKLTGMGFPIAGNARISVDDSNVVKSLQEMVDQHLKSTYKFSNGDLSLGVKGSGKKSFTEQVLSYFDTINAYQLRAEHKLLTANTTTQTPNMFMPASLVRTVIREALADLNILNLVQTLVDPTAQVTTMIPYEQRFDGIIPNDGIVYEGKGIPSAGVSLAHEVSYVNAMKLAMRLSNEVMHFSSVGLVNWNAWGENIGSNARLMKELIHRRVANEMLRAAMSYQATPVGTTTPETLAATNAEGITKTAQFPVVRPYQARDLKGNLVGLAECPIIIKQGATVLKEYTGELGLAAGNYWVLESSNLGYIKIVNQLGVAQVGVAVTISYYTPSNVFKFDLNPAAGVEYKKHLNGLLDRIGDAKTQLSSKRYSKPSYMAMSEELNNLAAKADQFVVSLKRDGTDTNSDGDLAKVRALPVFSTDAPAVDLSEQAILIGQRNLTTYTIAKPYSVGQPFEAVDSLGRPTGERIAYGEEYNSIYTPTPVRGRYTTVVVYDSLTR